MRVKMVKQPEFKEDYVVRLLDTKRGSTRDVVVSVVQEHSEFLSGYYMAALKAMGFKTKPTETVVRVSLKGYS